jgi:hypothetical protein
VGGMKEKGNRWLEILINAALPLLLVVFAASVCGFAQSSPRCVRGVVTDRRGNPLAAAVVQIEDKAKLDIR